MFCCVSIMVHDSAGMSGVQYEAQAWTGQAIQATLIVYMLCKAHEQCRILVQCTYTDTSLCDATMQWKKSYAPPPFYGADEILSVFVAAIMGLQHALTMSFNIITPPLVIFSAVRTAFPDRYPRGSQAEKENLDVVQYLINASLICSGIMTFVQVSTACLPDDSCTSGVA